MAENTQPVALVKELSQEIPQEIVEQGKGETGLSAAQVKVLSSTLLKGLQPQEMGLVFHQAKEYGLSVFRKELWAYKDGKGNLVTIAGRDGLLKVAARNPAFGGLRSGAVYAKDVCEIDLGAGTIKHAPALTARGNLLGAWAAVYRKDFAPMVVYYAVEDVRRDTPIWKVKPAEMVVARAESAALRRADVGVGGLYLEDEVRDPAELCEAAPAKIAEAQENAKAAIDDAKKRRKAAKEAVAGLPAPAAQGVVEVPKGDPAGVMEALVEAAATAPTPEEISAAQPEAKAFEDEAPAAVQETPYDVDSPAGYLRMQWEHPELPKHILATRKLAGSLEQYCARVLGRGMDGFALSGLSENDMETCLDAVMDRNSTFDLNPNTEKPAVLMASKDQVAALAKAMGGENWLKKHMRRAFGHDNAYALTVEQAEQLKASLNPAAVKSVDETLAQVAEKERAAGDQAPKSAADKLRAAWADGSLHANVLANRTPMALDMLCSMKLNRVDAKPDNLTPTEAETMISAVLARNAESPKK